MSASREELRHILKTVMDDLERDGYAVEHIASAMGAIGIQTLFGEEVSDALKALDLARQILLERQAGGLQ